MVQAALGAKTAPAAQLSTGSQRRESRTAGSSTSDSEDSDRSGAADSEARRRRPTSDRTRRRRRTGTKTHGGAPGATPRTDDAVRERRRSDQPDDKRPKRAYRHRVAGSGSSGESDTETRARIRRETRKDGADDGEDRKPRLRRDKDVVERVRDAMRARSAAVSRELAATRSAALAASKNAAGGVKKDGGNGGLPRWFAEVAGLWKVPIDIKLFIVSCAFHHA
jgi:hypothetical protein